MKPAPKISAKKNSQNTPKKLNSIQKFLLFLGFIVIAFTVLPAVVILFLGLLPTFTLLLIDSKNTNKITTVGCFNIAGVMMCLNNLFLQFSSGVPLSILDNIFNIIIMLAGAAVGLLLYHSLPDLFVYIFKNSAQHRLRTINAKLEKLSEVWANILPEDQN